MYDVRFRMRKNKTAAGSGSCVAIFSELRAISLQSGLFDLFGSWFQIKFVHFDVQFHYILDVIFIQNIFIDLVIYS
jgi:hypothetical protein